MKSYKQKWSEQTKTFPETNAKSWSSDQQYSWVCTSSTEWPRKARTSSTGWCHSVERPELSVPMFSTLPRPTFVRWVPTLLLLEWWVPTQSTNQPCAAQNVVKHRMILDSQLPCSHPKSIHFSLIWFMKTITVEPGIHTLRGSVHVDIREHRPAAEHRAVPEIWLIGVLPQSISIPPQ